MPLVTLTTDFGTNDWFVGTLHGVILSKEPRTRIVDITHAIPPGDIRAGAFALKCAAPYFPKGTVHVAIVDPGVGGLRRAIAVRTASAWFVGPDNGLLSWAVPDGDIRSIRSLENTKLFLPRISHTFHGRDIFAPIAARLTGRFNESSLGAKLNCMKRLPWPRPLETRTAICGEVIYVDRFGNAITNIAADLVAGRTGYFSGHSPRAWRCPLETHYGAVPPGRPVAVAGSSGLVEVAINQGSAARKLRLRTGDALRFTPST
jgi:S-adenosylmethionine hydrolase